MNTNEIREYKKTLKLSKLQRQILIGTLLGDGHLDTQDEGRTYRLKVEHSSAQREYLEWLHSNFSEWVRSGIYEKKRDDGREHIGFNTYSHGALRFYAHQFYDGKKKRIPVQIGKLLSPIALAVWFMDDGSWKSDSHRTFIIHTVGFARNELERVKEALKKHFGVEVNLHKQKEKYWRLYVSANSAEKFAKLVRPYVSLVPSMLYKLGNRNV